MGAWGLGPFENDAAADFLDQAVGSPGKAIKKAFDTAMTVRYLDVDEAGAAWAAAELVALALGRGTAKKQIVRDVLAEYRPTEKDRVQALRALARVASSELTDLWHEGAEGAAYDDLIDELHGRLGAASPKQG